MLTRLLVNNAMKVNCRGVAQMTSEHYDVPDFATSKTSTAKDHKSSIQELRKQITAAIDSLYGAYYSVGEKTHSKLGESGNVKVDNAYNEAREFQKKVDNATEANHDALYKEWLEHKKKWNKTWFTGKPSPGADNSSAV